MKQISERLPNTILAREAAKGSVALYNVKRIENATGSERDRYLSRARRDLGNSMWSELFS